jgi:ribulose-5-phosphate 4-epimerase/fuculose-1-phosphate aldolase
VDLRTKVAVGCRITAQQGLAREIAGHVSARIPGSEEMWIRCRGEYERGVRFTDDRVIRRVDFRGESEVGANYELPLELPIHGETYRTRPDAQAVVHAHPTYAVLCAVAGIELRPLYGCYDMAGFKLAQQGIPVFEQSRLINDVDVAAELLDCMGDHNVVLMRGHGLTAVGASVEEAVLNAVRVERLAQFNWQVAQLGRTVPDISAQDQVFFDTPRKRNVSRDTDWRWECYVAEDELEQASIPDGFRKA